MYVATSRDLPASRGPLRSLPDDQAVHLPNARGMRQVAPGPRFVRRDESLSTPVESWAAHAG